MTHLRRLPALLLAVLALVFAQPFASVPLAADPLRVVLLVDSSSTMAPMLTEFRAGLSAFIEAVPDDVEVVFVSTGGQLRLRVPATTDKVKLRDAVSHFSSDGGANSLIDTLLESDRRFLKPARDRRGLFVIVTTDQPSIGEPPVYRYNDFVKDFVQRRGRAHAVVIRNTQMGFTSQITENITANTDGLYTVMAVPNSLATRMRAIAAEVAAEQ